jgi:hypothetical protein
MLVSIKVPNIYICNSLVSNNGMSISPGQTKVYSFGLTQLASTLPFSFTNPNLTIIYSFTDMFLENQKNLGQF